MRRYKNLNESVKIDVVELTNNHDDILVNDLRDTLEDIGATVSQEKEDGTIYMVVDDLTYDDVVNELSPLVYDIDNYIVDTNLTEQHDYPDYEDDNLEYPDYEDDDLEYPDYEEDEFYDNMGNWDPIEDLDDEDWEDYDDELSCDGDDCFVDEDEDFNNIEYDEDDELNDDFDVDECYESYKPRYTSKRKGCCPPRKSKKRNLSEALKRNKLSIRDIIRSAKSESLNESTIKRAIKKMKMLKKDKLNEAIHNIGTAKYNLIIEAINAKRPVLYTKKTINGKNISKYSSKALFRLLQEAKKQYLNLKKRLNESNDKTLNEKIKNKKRLMELLDDELTYRLTFKKKMFEADEENMLKELPMGPDASSTDDEEKDKTSDNDADTNSENDEEVELSRIIITLDTQEAADELKQDLVDAGVPEDAITIGDEDEDETEETSDEDTDEEESEESEESDESNESTHYNNFKKLLEADDEDSESTDGEDTDEESETDETSDDEDTDEENTDEDEEIKLVLTDTDYIHTLADVLNDKYGITKEEFEEMIGGEIVDSDDEDSNDEDDSEDEESKKDDKEEKSSNGDDAVDAMSPEEIDKLFGDN